MRLLMVNNEFPPLGGGTGSVNRALLERFSHIDNLEIDLVTSSMNNHAEVEVSSGRFLLYKLPVFKRDIHHASNFELLTFFARSLPFVLQKHRERPYDLCFAWSAVPAGGVALALHWATGLPYVVRVCGPDIPGFERRYARMYPFLTPVIRQIWRESEVVVAKCQEEADMILSVDNEIKVEIIPNGVDLDAFQPSGSRLIKDHLHVLCVARLIERKGQRYLLKAVKRLADEGLRIKLSLVGTGDAEDEYRSLAERLGIIDLVTFWGYVPREEIVAHYAAADVFVLPSYNEGMSVAALEAMAAGLPLILTRTGGVSELVAHGGNGFTFDWGDEDALIDYLRRFAVDRALIGKFGAQSRERASRMSLDEIGQSYLSLIASLTNWQEALKIDRALV